MLVESEAVEPTGTKCLYLAMEEAMAPHSSTLAWKIPWTEEPGGLQSMGSHPGVGPGKQAVHLLTPGLPGVWL